MDELTPEQEALVRARQREVLDAVLALLESLPPSPELPPDNQALSTLDGLVAAAGYCAEKSGMFPSEFEKQALAAQVAVGFENSMHWAREELDATRQ